MLDTMLEDDATVGVPGTNAVSSDDNENFTNNLKKWTNKVVNDYSRYKVELNKNIASIAQANNLNNDQIQRLIEEVNTQIYLIEYNKNRNKLDRDVDFDIASLQTVKDLIGNDTKANREVQDDPTKEGEKADMNKKASAGGEDSLNFLNYTAYDTCGLSEDKKISKRDLLERMIIPKLASEQQEYEHDFREFTTDVYTMADALVKMAQLNVDVQDVFSTVCKEASLHKETQLFVKKAVEQRVNQLKENHKLPDKFACDIELVDGLTKEAKLSLGKHSLIKEANNSNKKLPTVVTDKKLIRDYNDLIDLAVSIHKRQNKISQPNKTQKILQAK
jgi:hypothetical protein